jgi:hypothetical protein
VRERRQPEVIAGRVNLDGSIATMTGGDAAVRRNAAGRYIIDLPFRPVAVTATSMVNAVPGAVVAAGPTLTSVEVWLNTPASVPTDAGFHFVAVGVQT